MEYLAELEKKVDTIIQTVEQLRVENASLKEAALKKEDDLAKINEENSSLKSELGQIRSTTEEHQDKLLAATDKIKSLIAKIDAA